MDAAPRALDGLRVLDLTQVMAGPFCAGVTARLGVDYATLAAVNPRLIHCSIPGLGQTGPYADRGGYDLIAQGMSGIMSATGSEGGAPVKVGVPITDLGAGLFGVFGILCANNLFPRFCALLGLQPLVHDPRFDSVADRLKNRAVLQPLIEAVTVTQPRAHWLARCEEAGVPAGPIYSVPEALDDPHARARGMVQELSELGLGEPEISALREHQVVA